MGKGYIVITRDEDGDIRCAELTEQELMTRLNERYYGKLKFTSRADGDPNDWEGDNAMCVIRGEVIVPKPAQTTIEWKFD